jgi:hypothetical protein
VSTDSLHIRLVTKVVLRYRSPKMNGILPRGGYLNHKISDCAADATNICRSLPLGGSLAATINLKNVEAPEVEPPRQLQMHSGQRVTSRGDSDQDKSFQKRQE